jgi:hypothetical protein
MISHAHAQVRRLWAYAYDMSKSTLKWVFGLHLYTLQAGMNNLQERLSLVRHALPLAMDNGQSGSSLQRLASHSPCACPRFCTIRCSLHAGPYRTSQRRSSCNSSSRAQKATPSDS